MTFPYVEIVAAVPFPFGAILGSPRNGISIIFSGKRIERPGAAFRREARYIPPFVVQTSDGNSCGVLCSITGPVMTALP